MQVCIFCSAGPLACRRRPLSSNVRQRKYDCPAPHRAGVPPTPRWRTENKTARPARKCAASNNAMAALGVLCTSGSFHLISRSFDAEPNNRKPIKCPVGGNQINSSPSGTTVQSQVSTMQALNFHNQNKNVHQLPGSGIATGIPMHSIQRGIALSRPGSARQSLGSSCAQPAAPARGAA